MSKRASIFLRGILGAFIANVGDGKIGMVAESSREAPEFTAAGAPSSSRCRPASWGRSSVARGGLGRTSARPVHSEQGGPRRLGCFLSLA